MYFLLVDDTFYRCLCLLIIHEVLGKNQLIVHISGVCCCSVAQLCLTLCDPMDCSTPASLSFTIPHLELAQIHVHWVSDAIQPSHLFFACLQSFPVSGSFLMSRLFASGSQSTGVSASASVLPMNIQDWFPLGWTGWLSLQSKGLSRVFSNTTVRKHQFFSIQPSLWSNSHIHIWPGKTITLTTRIFVGKIMSIF